jgi:hypothetical protein
MVVGAAALAVHGYARQSVDLDLAVYANPFEAFRQSQRDIHDLLRANPKCDREKIADLAKTACLDKDWAAFISRHS